MQKTLQARNKVTNGKRNAVFKELLTVSIVPIGSLHNSLWPNKAAKIDICFVTPAHDSSLVAQLQQSQMPFTVFVFARSTNINSLLEDNQVTQIKTDPEAFSTGFVLWLHGNLSKMQLIYILTICVTFA